MCCDEALKLLYTIIFHTYFDLLYSMDSDFTEGLLRLYNKHEVKSVKHWQYANL